MLATLRTAAVLPALPPFLAYLRLEIRRSLRNRRYLVFTVVFPVDALRPVHGRPAVDRLGRRSTACPGTCTSWSRWPPTAPWAPR